MVESSADCVIVGGGIGGTVLALALGQEGHHVVLLEKELRPPPAGRPEVLARLTMEIFQQLGVGERILQEAAVPIEGLELWRTGNGRLLHFAREDFLRVNAQPYSTDPTRTRQILLEAAQAHSSVEVHRGVEVQELSWEGGRVTGVQAIQEGKALHWRSRLVVGDDGGRSRIRNAMGIHLTTRDFPFEFLGAAGPALRGQMERTGQAWLNPNGLKKGIFGGVFMPQPGKRTAFVFLLSPESYFRFSQGHPSNFYEAARRLSPLCEGMEKPYRFPEDFTHFRRPFGHAPRYVGEGVALLGDAAHPVTPAGGQGANMSVADAVVLADVVLKCLKRDSISSRQLAPYEAERRPANQRSIQFSVWGDRVFRTLKLLPWMTPLLPWYMKRVDQKPAWKARFIRAVSQTFKATAGARKSLGEFYPKRFDVVLLTLASMVLLIASLRMPVVTVRKLWETNTFSIVTGILNLKKGGYIFLALLIFFFSIVFPISKLTALLIVWFVKLQDRHRAMILYVLEVLGRWSMLDVFVVAVTIVTVKLGALASARAEVGIYYFGASILLAMIVTGMVHHLARRAGLA